MQSFLKTFEANDKIDLGMGWHIIKSESGKNVHWHNGGTGGYTSSMAIDTEGKNAVIILTNVSAFNPKMGQIDQLCFALTKLLVEAE